MRRPKKKYGQFLEDNRQTAKEFVEAHRDFLAELCLGYSSETALDILVQFVQTERPPKILPPAKYSLSHKKGKYFGEILDRNDPRGFTIGPKTGCCMRIGGVAEECVQSGYADSQAGFFALYGNDGRIVAQSYFYVNPDRPDILVMDNIESNSGRDANVIVDLYQDFFRQYLAEQFKKNPDWQIKEIHVGTGYGELVKPIVLRLPEAEIVRNSRMIYSDADSDQRMLLQFSKAEVTAAKIGRLLSESPATSSKEVNNSPYVSVSSASERQFELLQALESEIYPSGMRQFSDDFLESELSQPNVNQYSFIVNSNQDATVEPVGYCLAYEADSETDPSFDGKCLYVSDFGILPQARPGRTALRAFRELIRRANSRHITKIEMSARESTSYQLFMNSVAQRYLGEMGFRVVDYGVDQSFGDTERTHLLALEAI